MKRNYGLSFGYTGKPVEIDLPASKSISNRILVMNALSGGKIGIANIAGCDDTDAMRSALAQFGAGGASLSLNVGAAGTAMRFLTAFLAIQPGRTATLDGSPRMRRRPIGELVQALRRCGADIRFVTPSAGVSDTGCPPLLIVGKRLAADGKVSINGGISSQYISALMMIAPYMRGGLSLAVEGALTSRPYVEMTASLMRLFGADVEISGSGITIGEGGYGQGNFTVESDWSAASYWYEIKSLVPQLPVTLKGLQEKSLQGDSRIAGYFAGLGVSTEFSGGCAILSDSGIPVAERLEIDLSGQPDLAQTLAVTACLKGVPFSFSGLSTLKIKETDRIYALVSQLRKLGFVLEDTGNGGLLWDGSRCRPQENPEIETFDDHRMAMAFAPAAVFRRLTIRDAEVVGKSYPDFWKHLAKAGFCWEEKEWKEL